MLTLSMSTQLLVALQLIYIHFIDNRPTDEFKMNQMSDDCYLLHKSAFYFLNTK